MSDFFMRLITENKRKYYYFFHFRDPPKTHDDWLKILQQQESLHALEMVKWQKVLQTAIELLRKVSIVCEKIVSDVTLLPVQKVVNNIKDEL